ncbi:3-hydroxybutyrate dehydrogenase [Rhodoferax sp.]|uniref:3-hydroxybutyrate dehydrogenase n=1 Tax=Rhodoferax sp. TaxID=50421 RepID=UPI0025EF74A0|nr:3-hydroxybutyrate dehydrogenase [Rhodoferax sp.]
MLNGKTALVTGSTSGIGLGIALELAKQGANIILNGFGDHTGPKAEVEALGVKVGYSGADMSKPAEIAAMIAYADAEFGGVDILVNNAGIQYVAPIEEFPIEKWDSIIAINLSAAFHATRLVIPGMRAKNWGRVISIASAHGLVGSAQKVAYVAAKHGIVGMTKVVALETAQTGITVNAICPGWVHTPLVQKQIEDRAAAEKMTVEQATKELLQEKEPSLQFTTVEQLGGLAVFMCSPAADNIRGVAWAADGGWTAQ